MISDEFLTENFARGENLHLSRGGNARHYCDRGLGGGVDSMRFRVRQQDCQPIAGFKTQIASVFSGLLLLSFAMGMVTGLGIKKPFGNSVFSATAAALLLAFWEPDRFTLDKHLTNNTNSLW